MRRHKNLYKEIASFSNLLKAARLAQRGKRYKTPTAHFNYYLENELWRLHEELATKKYKPGKYHHFTIYEPKQRVISAAPYRDRVVHHALHNVLEPIFDPTFIYDSYATRKGKGTHAALDRFQSFSRRCSYALKCDIQKYFPSIDRQILISLIKRKIACDDTLWLMGRILEFHDGPEVADRGIPIGNLTSQFFANIYLNGLDHFIKQDLVCSHYLRYMDDYVIFDNDKDRLWYLKQLITDYVEKLSLRLHSDKCCVYKTSAGVPFFGMIIFPERRRLKRQNVIRFKRRLRKFQREYENGDVSWAHINQSIQSWIGHALHAETARLRGDILSNTVFRKG